MRKIKTLTTEVELTDESASKVIKLLNEGKLPEKFTVEGHEFITKEIVGEVVEEATAAPVEAPKIEEPDKQLFEEMSLEDKIRSRGVDMSWLDRARAKR